MRIIAASPGAEVNSYQNTTSQHCRSFVQYADDTSGGTKVCRYYWHSAGSLGWPFPMLKYKYIFQIKYTEAILSNSTRKLLWFEITKMLIAFKKFFYCIICYNFWHTFVPYRLARYDFLLVFCSIVILGLSKTVVEL